MRKKRFIACLLAVLLIAVLSVTLVACKEKPSQITLPDVPVSTEEAPAAGDLLLVMLKGMGYSGEFVNMNFESFIKSKSKDGIVYYKFFLKGNFLPNSNSKTGEVELGLGLTACDVDGNDLSDKSGNFAIYLKEGRFYMSVAGRSFYLEDVDFKWLIEQLRKIDGLQNLVDTILGAIPGLDLKGTEVDELIKLVAMLIFEIDNQATTYDSTTGTGHISLKFNPDQLIGTVVGALGGTSIDGILGGIGLTLKGPTGEPIYIDDFLKTLAFPNVDVYVEADVENEELKMNEIEPGSGKFGLQLHVYDYANEYFQMSTSSAFTQGKIEFIPAEIAKYEPFGLLKLKFKTSFDLNIDRVDVGTLVNFFAGDGFLPEGSLTLSAHAGLVVDIDADIRLKEEIREDGKAEGGNVDDRSLLLIEVRAKDATEPMIGIYLKEGKVYVNLDNLINEGGIAITPGNIVVSGVNVTSWLQRLIKIGTDAVSGLLDSLFLKDSGAATQTFAAVGDNGFDYSKADQIVLTLGHNEENKTYISPTIGTILDVLRYTTGFEDFFKYNPATGNINIKVTNKFFEKLCTQFNLNVPALKNLDDFGEVNLGVNVDDNGLKNVYLDLNLQKIAEITGRIVLSDFRYGFGEYEVDKDGNWLYDNEGRLVRKLETKINNALTKENEEGIRVDKDYLGNLSDFIFRAIDDLDLEFNAKLTITPGKYYVGNILGIATGLVGVNDKDNYIEVVESFILDITLKVQIQVDSVQVGTEKVPVLDEKGEQEKDKNGKPIFKDEPVYKKIISRANISITNAKANPLFPADNMEVKLVYLDDRFPGNHDAEPAKLTRESNETHGILFADMSKFDMLKLGIPSFAIGIDLTDLIFTELEKIAKGIEFGIPDGTIENLLDQLRDLLNGLISDKFGKAATASTMSYSASTNSAGSSEMFDNVVYAMFNQSTAKQATDLLNIHVTTAMINKILGLIPGVNLGFELPNIDINGAINLETGIKLNVSASDREDETKQIAVELGINRFIIGAENEVDISEFKADMAENPEKYGAFVSVSDLTSDNKSGLADIIMSIVNRALDDVDMSMDLDITLGAGTYDLSNILGIKTGLPKMPINVGDNPFELKLGLSIKLQSEIVPKLDIMGKEIPDQTEQIISRAIITLKNNGGKNPLTPNGNGYIQMMYFDDRGSGNGSLGLEEYNAVKLDETDKDGNDVYKINKTHGTLLLQLSTFKLMGLTLPDVALDIDLTQTLNKVLGDMLNNAFKPATPPESEEGGATTQANSSTLARGLNMLSAVSDGTTSSSAVSALHLNFTAALINNILKLAGSDMSFEVLNANISVDAEKGVDLAVSTVDGDKDISAHIGNIKLKLGTAMSNDAMKLDFEQYLNEDGTLNDTYPIEEMRGKTYLSGFGDAAKLTVNSLVKTLIARSLDDANIELGLDFLIKADDYDIGELLSAFGLEFGEIPITVTDDFALNLVLKVKLQWGKFNDGTSGIARGEISLYNSANNVFFKQGTILHAYYGDDRAVMNAGSVIPQQFQYVEGGAKKTHGTLFIDCTYFEKVMPNSPIKLPSFALDIDLTEQINNIIKQINLGDNSIIPAEMTADLVTQTFANALGVVADGDVTTDDNACNYFQVMITLELLQELLKSFNLTLNLPPELQYINGDLTLSRIDGISLGINYRVPKDEIFDVDGNIKEEYKDENGNLKEEYLSTILSLGLDIKAIELGKSLASNNQINIDLLDFDTFGQQALTSVGSIITRLLDDINIKVEFDLKVPQGKHNFAPFLQMAGIDIDELFLEVTNDFVLQLEFVVQIQMEQIQITETIDGKEVTRTETYLALAKIELNNKVSNIMFEKGNIISMYYFDDRYYDNLSAEEKDRIKLEPYTVVKDSDGKDVVTKTHGTLFADFSGLKIANISIPPIKLDIDLTNTINGILDDLNRQIDKNNNQSVFAGNSRSQMGLVADEPAGGDNGITETEPKFGLEKLTNYLSVKIATTVIENILKTLNVDLGGIVLPDFSVELAGDVTQGIAINIKLNVGHPGSGAGGTNPQQIEGMISFPSLAIGAHIDKMEIPTNFRTAKFDVDFGNLVKNLLQHGKLSAKVNIGANASELNIQRLLNNLLAASNLTLNLPINVDLNDFANTLDLVVQWEFDYDDPSRTKLLLEFKCDNTIAIALYLQGGTIYVDLSGLGLPQFKLTKSGIAKLLTNIIGNSLDGLLDSLIKNSGIKGLQEASANANNMTTADMNTSIYEAALNGEIDSNADDNGIISYLNLLLKGITIVDGEIRADFAADVIREVLKKLSVNIAEDITLNLSANIKTGTINLNATFDEISLGAVLKLENLGVKDESFIIDLSNISSFPELDASSGNKVVSDLFDRLFEDPDADGIWIDLISKNRAITSAGNAFKFTKMTITKAPAEGMTLHGYTSKAIYVNAGSIVVTLMRMDGWGGVVNDSSRPYLVGEPALYIILDVKSGKMSIKVTDDLLPNPGLLGAVGQQVDTIVNNALPAFDVNVRKILSDLLGPIITQINDGNIGLTADGETTATDEKEGFSLDIMSLLKGVKVKVYGVRNIKITVELNAIELNDILIWLFDEMLTGMPIDLGSGPIYVGELRYKDYVNNPSNQNSGTEFLERLWSGLIFPIVKQQVNNIISVTDGIINSLTASIKDSLLDLLSRLVPFPNFAIDNSELNLNVYIVNGKLDNIQLAGHAGDSWMQNGNLVRDTIELRIFNDLSKQVFFGKIDPVNLNDTTFQAPYVHFDVALDSEQNFMNKFVDTAYKPDIKKMYYENTRDQNPSYLIKASDVSWGVTFYSSTSLDDANELAEGSFIAFDPKAGNMDAFKNGGVWKPGYYKVEGIATKYGSSAKTTVRVIIDNSNAFFNVTINEQGFANNLAIDDIEIRAGRSLPESITINKVDDMGNPTGEQVYIRNIKASDTQVEITKFEFVDADQQTIGEHVREDAYVRIFLKNPDKEIKVKVRVIWDDANLVLVDAETPIEISLFEYMDFVNNIYNAQKMLVRTSDGRRIYQDVNDVYITDNRLFEVDSTATANNGRHTLKLDENRKVVLTNSDIWNSDKNYETTIRIKLANARENQAGDQGELTRKLIVKSRKIDFVRFDSKNRIVMNDLQTERDLPRTAHVFFKNGDSGYYDVNISSWRGTFQIGTKGTYTGNMCMLNVDYNFDENDTNAANWVKDITIVVNETQIAYAKVGDDNELRATDISYKDFANQIFNGKKFENGLDLRLISTDGKSIDYLNDSIRYISRWVKDKNNTDNRYKPVILNDPEGYGRKEYSDLEAQWNADEANKNIPFPYTPEYETFGNYTVDSRGITVGNEGGEVRLTIILHYLKPDPTALKTPSEYEADKKYVTTYLYFNVAKPEFKELSAVVNY